MSYITHYLGINFNPEKEECSLIKYKTKRELINSDNIVKFSVRTKKSNYFNWNLSKCRKAKIKMLYVNHKLSKKMDMKEWNKILKVPKINKTFIFDYVERTVYQVMLLIIIKYTDVISDKLADIIKSEIYEEYTFK